jgi:hypothetical protein
VGHDEDPKPLVRRANLCRAEQTRRRRVAQSPKFSQDGCKTEGDVTGDVFEEYPFGGTFPDDAGDLGPKVARIIGTSALASSTEGLAGVTGEDDVEGSTEDPGIEAAQIVPDWRRGEVFRALCGNEDCTGVTFPLDEGAGVKAGFGQHDAQIKASAACAEGQSVPGT